MFGVKLKLTFLLLGSSGNANPGIIDLELELGGILPAKVGKSSSEILFNAFSSSFFSSSYLFLF